MIINKSTFTKELEKLQTYLQSRKLTRNEIVLLLNAQVNYTKVRVTIELCEDRFIKK